MTPSIGEKRLQTIRQAVAILCLQRVIAGGSGIAQQVEFTSKNRTRRNENVLPHRFAPSRPKVSERDDVSPANAVLDRCVPLIGSRQHMVWIDHSHDRPRRARLERSVTCPPLPPPNQTSEFQLT